MKILVVDDDPAILNALDANLTSFGYHVESATSGFEALKVIKSSTLEKDPVKFLVTGLKIPGMNGIELIRSARELIPALKAIIITGYGDNNVRRDIKDLEGCEYLEKPFEPEKLLKSILELKAREGV